jgi:LPS export ABC transporter protein LptC
MDKVILKGLIIFGMLYLLFWVYDRYFLQVWQQSTGANEVEIPSAQVDKVLIRSFNKKGWVQVKLFGAIATVDEKLENTLIKPVHMILYGSETQGERKATILAKEGTYHRSVPAYFELIGNVEGNLLTQTSSKIQKLFTDKLLFYPELNKFVSPGKFKIVDEENLSIISGDSLEYNIKKEQGEIRGSFLIRQNETPAMIMREMNQEFSHEP